MDHSTTILTCAGLLVGFAMWGLWLMERLSSKSIDAAQLYIDALERGRAMQKDPRAWVAARKYGLCPPPKLAPPEPSVVEEFEEAERAKHAPGGEELMMVSSIVPYEEEERNE